jgi:hypothetical protein
MLVQRLVIAFVLCSGLHTAALAQARPGAAALKPCSLLTRELALKANPKQALDAAGPKEVPLGASGSACEWGDLLLQIDPFSPARLEELRKTDGKNWEAIPSVGDAAYFHNIRNQMAELFVRVGTRTFGVVITIPVGSTAAASKPHFIAVAEAIVPKLR